MEHFLWVVLGIAATVRAVTLVAAGAAAALEEHRYPINFLMTPVYLLACVLDGPGAVAGAVLAATDEAWKAVVAGVLAAVLAGFCVHTVRMLREC